MRGADAAGWTFVVLLVVPALLFLLCCGVGTCLLLAGSFAGP